MKAFIYDMDGVIVDSEPVHLRVEQQILAKQGVTDTTIEHLEKYQGSRRPLPQKPCRIPCTCKKPSINSFCGRTGGSQTTGRCPSRASAFSGGTRGAR